MSDRRSVRRQGRLEGIVAAAARLLVDGGYDALTLDRLGEEVGLAKASLYYYVRSKDELLALIYATAVDQVLATETRRAGGQALEDPVAALRNLVVAHLSFGLDHPLGRPLVALHDQVLSNPALDGARAGLERYRSHVRSIVEAGAGTGAFEVADIELATDLVNGLLYTAMRRLDHWSGAATPDPRRAIDEVARITLRALGADEAAERPSGKRGGRRRQPVGTSELAR